MSDKACKMHVEELLNEVNYDLARKGLGFDFDKGKESILNDVKRDSRDSKEVRQLYNIGEILKAILLELHILKSLNIGNAASGVNAENLVSAKNAICGDSAEIAVYEANAINRANTVRGKIKKEDMMK